MQLLVVLIISISQYVDDGLGGRFANYEPNLDESVPDFKPGETELSEQSPQTQNMADKVEKEILKAMRHPDPWDAPKYESHGKHGRLPEYKDKRVPPPEEMVA